MPRVPPSFRCASLILAVTLAVACSDQPTAPLVPSLSKSGGGTTTLAVTSTTPSSATQDTTLNVQVSGSAFDAGSQAQWLLNGSPDPRVRTNTTRYVSSSALVANITIAPDAVPASYDVAVTTGSGKKAIGSGLFVVTLRPEYLSNGNLATDVNASGYAVGYAIPAGSCVQPRLWAPDGSQVVLPVPGPLCAAADGINDSGVVVGYSRVGSGGQLQATVWTPGPSGYTMMVIPPTAGGLVVETAWDVNSSGQVLVSTSGSPFSIGVWSMTDSTYIPLARPAGALLGCQATGGGHGISDAGAITGFCVINSVVSVYSWATATSLPVRLPLPSGSSSPSVRGINTAGVIAGQVSVVSGHTTTSRATRWVPSGASFIAQSLPDLGAGSGGGQVAQSGDFGGCVFFNGSCVPVVWLAGGPLHFLGYTGSSAPGVSGIASTATGGFITGSGVRNGVRVAMRWRY